VAGGEHKALAGREALAVEVDLGMAVVMEHRGKETMVVLALLHLVMLVVVAVENLRLAQVRVAVLAVMVALVKQ
tara:strand:- start:300 stop:521 length:222 start_codon:yes stop_codon:yes gene_type:complete